LLRAQVSGGNISDKEGAIKILKHNQLTTLKKVWGDAAYQGADLGNIFSSFGIDLEVVKRPRGKERVYNTNPGAWKAVFYPIKRKFTILPKRWVVERTYAWLGRNRRLSKDYEYLPEVSEAYLYAAMAKTVVRRFKNNF
jgi:putative transposase